MLRMFGFAIKDTVLKKYIQLTKSCIKQLDLYKFFDVQLFFYVALLWNYLLMFIRKLNLNYLLKD